MTTMVPHDMHAEAMDSGLSFSEAVALIASRWKLLLLAPLAAALLALAATFLVAPTFTATTTFLPPQQSQSGAASALATLSALGSVAGGFSSISSPGERYIAFLRSVSVTDRIVDQFKLMDVYEVRFRVDARRQLGDNVNITLGKKDGLISIQVDDEDPQRAAAIANRYVEELRRLTGTLAVTEAQQRRAFFEGHLLQSKSNLAKAQQALETSGFNAGALKAEPKSAADAYARLKAETTAAEMKLRLLRGALTDSAPEVVQQLVAVSALREQLARAESASDRSASSDYVGKYREFKYQETLFEVYARQFELARGDESREGALIQVVDAATPPEKKSRPKRAIVTIATALATGLGLLAWLLLRHGMRSRPTASS